MKANIIIKEQIKASMEQSYPSLILELNLRKLYQITNSHHSIHDPMRAQHHCRWKNNTKYKILTKIQYSKTLLGFQSIILIS